MAYRELNAIQNMKVSQIILVFQRALAFARAALGDIGFQSLVREGTPMIQITDLLHVHAY
jgi:hypothetical protein